LFFIRRKIKHRIQDIDELFYCFKKKISYNI